jgi:hypothetical protein
MRQAGGYLPQLAWYSDWFAYLVIGFRHGVCHIPEMLGVRTLGLPEQYSAAAGRGEEHIRVLESLLDVLHSPEYADVAPFFRQTQVATNFGTDWFRAVARRADTNNGEMMGWLRGFSPESCEELLNDPDPATAKLAQKRLGEIWRATRNERNEMEAALQRLETELHETRLRLPPPGTVGKLRWLAGLMTRRIRRVA